MTRPTTALCSCSPTILATRCRWRVGRPSNSSPTESSALAQARTSAEGGDISVAGGADTVNQFLAAGLLDILRLHVVPVTVGFSGRTDIVRVFDGVPPRSLEIADVRSTPEVTHITYDLR